MAQNVVCGTVQKKTEQTLKKANKNTKSKNKEIPKGNKLIRNKQLLVYDNFGQMSLIGQLEFFSVINWIFCDNELCFSRIFALFEVFILT